MSDAIPTGNKPNKGAKAGKKNRKYGRHKTRSPAMARYRNENRREKNKKRKLEKHLKQHSNDKQSLKAYNSL